MILVLHCPAAVFFPHAKEPPDGKVKCAYEIPALRFSLPGPPAFRGL